MLSLSFITAAHLSSIFGGENVIWVMRMRIFAQFSFNLSLSSSFSCLSSDFSHSFINYKLFIKDFSPSNL